MANDFGLGYCDHLALYRHGANVTFKLPGPEVIKLFSCSIQLSMKFQMLIKVKLSRTLASFRLFFLLINVKMPTIFGILTFMSRKNFMLN